MTIPSPALASAGREPPLRLLLTACGRHGGIVALMEEAAPVIAAALALPLRHLADPEAPPEALAALHAPPAAGDAGWLAPLPLDPGLPLPGACCWAEVLGAGRQPCLLLLRGDELDTGRPAAAAALLRQWHAPLLGLLQVGGPWCASARRDDGLPWLGWLPRRGDTPGEPSRDWDEGVAAGLVDARLLPLLRRRLALLDLT
ncbi:MAG: hypothetical protein ACK5N0_10355 [Synechococcaceae cyanobacterium]